MALNTYSEYSLSGADPEVLKGRGQTEGSVSLLSYVIANAHNELVYTRFIWERRLAEKNSEAAATAPPLNPSLQSVANNYDEMIN